MKFQGLLVLILSLSVTRLADADMESGPKPGDKVPTLKAYAVTGNPSGQEVDYGETWKNKPSIYTFVVATEFDRPMFRFLKKLESDLGDKGNVVAVWLNDDADQSKNYLPKISKYFNKTSLAVFKGVDGPQGWLINTDARLTAVVAVNGKVVHSTGYLSLNETDAPKVVKALQDALQ